MYLPWFKSWMYRDMQLAEEAVRDEVREGIEWYLCEENEELKERATKICHDIR